MPIRLSSALHTQCHEKAKGTDGGDALDEVLAVARAAGAPLGTLLKEKPEPGLSALWAERVTASNVAAADVAPALARLLAPKDDAELQSVRRAAHLSASVLEKFVVNKIESVVDDEGKARAKLCCAAVASWQADAYSAA